MPICILNIFHHIGQFSGAGGENRDVGPIMKGPLLLTSGLSFLIWKSRHILTFYFPSDERVPPKKCTFAVLVIYVRMGMVKKIQFNDIFHEITRINFSHSNLASY